MRQSVLRRPGFWAGIVLLQLALAALTHFVIFPALGVGDAGLYPIIFFFLVGTAVSVLIAAAAERSAGGLLLSDALGGVASPAFVLDADGRFLTVNPAAEKLLEIEPGSGAGNLPEPRLRQAVDAADVSGTADAFAGGAVLALQGLPRRAVVFRLAGDVMGGESARRLVFLRDASDQIAANSLAGEISQIMARLGDNAAGIADSARNMSRDATRQAQSLSGITETMGDFAKKIQSNTESSEKGTQLAAQAREAAERSGNEISNALTAMTDVQDAGIRIARIVKLIDDIAFQTNLLALNAAVEAARAGRQGKGFAVVADEVRNLAGRSAKAAKDTASMVEDVTVRIGNASAYIAKLEEMLNNIVQDAVRMADSSVAATAKSAEQVNGILMVNEELGEISHATGSTISAADATTTSVEIMNSQVASLGQKMQELLAGLFHNSGRSGRAGGDSAHRAAAADRDWQTGSSMLTAARQPASADFSTVTGKADLFGGGFGAGSAVDEEEFEAPFKRLAAGERGWERASAASAEAGASLFSSDGYTRPGATKGNSFAETFQSGGEAATADGDRVVRPRQNIPLDDAEFGRY